jgi:hypothetical protein
VHKMYCVGKGIKLKVIYMWLHRPGACQHTRRPDSTPLTHTCMHTCAPPKHVCIHTQHTFNGVQGLSNLAWALAVAGVRPSGAWLSEFWHELGDQVEHLSAKDVAHIFWYVLLSLRN